MSALHVCSDDAVSGQLVGVYPISALRLLEDAQVHVGLGHSPDRRFQTSVPPVPDIVSAKSNRHFFLHRTPGTLERSPPTVSFFFPSPLAFSHPPDSPVSVTCPFPVTPAPPVRFPSRSGPRSSPFPTLYRCRQAVLPSAILPAFSGGLKVTVLASHGTYT